MDFVALDVETANNNVGSICQIGLAGYERGVLIQEWSSLVNPGEGFSPFNTRIHGLTAIDVAQAPALPDLAETLRLWFQGRVIVCHTLFDRTALARAFAKYGMADIDCRWLDSCRVARQAWAGLSPAGFGLKTVCGLIGHTFQHHDALADAKAAGAVMLAAQAKTGLSVDAWLNLFASRRGPKAGFNKPSPSADVSK
jgi:DNA polymerase-3 subunit epsilon